MEELAVLFSVIIMVQHYHAWIFLSVTYEDDDIRRHIYGEY